MWTTIVGFLLLALLAGLGVALAAAPLGAFIVWQRMAYFGDTLAHSALLGVAFSLLLSIHIQAGIVIICALVAGLLTFWQSRGQLPTDTLLGIISHSSLAIGLILVSVLDRGPLNITGYLLGDILATTTTDVLLIYTMVVIIALLVWRFWTALLSITVNHAMARVEGVPVRSLQLLLMILLAVTIALAIKVVGVLLIAALLVIPAASARYVSRTPEQMVGFSAIYGSLAVIGGLAASFFWDTPAGPSIVAAASTFLLFTLLGCRLV